MQHANKLTLAFLPAALEVQASPPPKFARATLWLLLALIILAIIWACVSNIDIVATAQGKIVPSGKVKTIQPLQAGIVREIYVIQGQHIVKGEPLLALDSSINQAELTKLAQEISAVKYDIKRTEQLVLYITQRKRELLLIADANAFDNAAGAWLLSSVNEFDAKVVEFELNIKSLEAEKASALINVNRYQKTLPIVESRAQSLRKLNSESLVSTDQYLQIEQEHIEQQQALAYEQARVKQIAATIEATEQQQRSFFAEFRTQRHLELNQFKRQLLALQQDYAKAATTEQQQILYAPVSGIVERISISTIGGVVTPAQELMQIVPDGRSLVVEAGLQNKDIGFVTAGQVAEIKLEAFPFMQYGVIDGEVTNVSADAVEHEQLGLIFPIKAKLTSEKIWVNNRWVKLQPGMQATVEIKTGQRRIIEFLLAPVLRGLDEGVRER